MKCIIKFYTCIFFCIGCLGDRKECKVPFHFIIIAMIITLRDIKNLQNVFNVQRE